MNSASAFDHMAVASREGFLSRGVKLQLHLKVSTVCAVWRGKVWPWEGWS